MENAHTPSSEPALEARTLTAETPDPEIPVLPVPASGFASDPFAAMIAKVRAQLPPDAFLDPDTLTITRRTGRGEESPISQPFHVRHEAICDGRPSQLVVEVFRGRGRSHIVSVPSDDLGKSAPRGVALLRAAGLRIYANDSRFAELLRVMRYPTVDSPAVDPGWVSRDPPVYALANGGLVATSADHVSGRADALMPLDEAALASWREQVAVRFTPHPIPLFMLCTAFAGPLMQLVEAQSVLFNLAATTSEGKSFLTGVLQRVWPGEGLVSWTGTRAALDDACIAANDGCIFFDEIRAPRLSAITDTAFVVTNGVRRNARPAPGRVNEQKHWRGVGLSSSEHAVYHQAVVAARKTQGAKPLSELVLPVPEGLFVRLIDIGGRDQKIWRHGPDVDVAAEMGALDRASQATAGVAGPAFVRACAQMLLASRQARTRAMFAKSCKDLKAYLGVAHLNDLTPEGRVVRHFALVQSAGILASHAQILPQSPAQITAAVRAAADSWARIRGVGRHAVADDPVARLRAWIHAQLGKGLREVDAARRPVGRQVVWNAAGWFNDEFYYLRRETLMNFVPAGATLSDLRAMLIACGALVVPEGQASKQHKLAGLGGPTLRAYALLREVIDRTPDDEEEDGYEGEDRDDAKDADPDTDAMMLWLVAGHRT